MENIDNIIEKLLAHGAISVVGMDESGELLYSINPTLKDVMPDLYNQHLQDVNSEVMNLWAKGFVSIDLFEKDPLVTLTEKAFDSDALSSLSNSETWSLHGVKRVLASKS